jgi:hypothetical protein
LLVHAKHLEISEFGHAQALLGAENELEGLFEGHKVQLEEDVP